jgi:hypothetical protein
VHTVASALGSGQGEARAPSTWDGHRP